MSLPPISDPQAPPSRILIVRLSAIGDVVHALPVLNALRQARPSAVIGWLVEELSAPLLEGHPQLDRLYVIPKKRWRKGLLSDFRREAGSFFRQIRAERWDTVLDLQGLTKSGLAAFATGAKRRVGFGDKDGREISRLFYTHPIRPPVAARHVVERNLSLLSSLGISPPPDTPGSLPIRAEELDAMAGQLRAAGWSGNGLLGINPGAGWVTKRHPPVKLAELGLRLARDFGHQPIVLWGPGEEPLRDAMLTVLRDAGGFAAPPTRIRAMAVLLSMLSAYIGGDTGPSHLAALFGVPTIAIFGASDASRNMPWPRARCLPVQRTDLDCVPCWKRECPLEGERHIACLRGIETGDLHRRAAEWLAPRLAEVPAASRRT